MPTDKIIDQISSLHQVNKLKDLDQAQQQQQASSGFDIPGLDLLPDILPDLGIVDGLKDAAGSVADTVSGAAGAVADGAKAALDTVGNAAGAVGEVAGSVAETVGEAAEAVGSVIGAIGDILNF